MSNTYTITKQRDWIEFKEQPTLSEVVKAMEWGSNNVIRKQGFRVGPGDVLFKKRPSVKDPYEKINSRGLIVSTPKNSPRVRVSWPFPAV